MRFRLLARRMFLAPVLSLALAAATAACGSSSRHTLASLHAALAVDEGPEPPFEPVRGLPRSGVHWVEPRLVAQVGFTEWTADGQLRHPRFQGLRRDKDPADVVRERP
jgi:bifunctional non-homologous end joining protein LigD